MSAEEHAEKAAVAMAHLYVWESIVSILEGSTTPDRQDAKAAREVMRVARIARSEMDRLVGIYDKHIATLTTAQQAAR